MPSLTTGFSELVDRYVAPQQEPEYALTGAARFANTHLVGSESASTAVFSLSGNTIECSDIIATSNVCKLCAHMPQSECRFVVMRKTRKRKGLRKKRVTVVLLWLPTDAPIAERVKYKAMLGDFCAQLRHYDNVVTVSEWCEFSRSSIMARIAEQRKAEKADRKQQQRPPPSIE
ncbi:hypothetical protein H4R19_006971 [Coemansia spiralis]|nr:hypothetical protein H4R19_006971 [Coemansia spiralis]